MPTVTECTVTGWAGCSAVRARRGLNDKRARPKGRGANASAGSPQICYLSIAQSGMWHRRQTTGHPPGSSERDNPRPVASIHSPTSLSMAPSPTPNAPSTQAELVELLKDDEMVKVAGEPTAFSRPD